MEYLATENIPLWAISYIEYGELDDLTEEDKTQVDDFLASYGEGIYIDYGEHEFFTWYPAFGLPTNCVEGKIYKT